MATSPPGDESRGNVTEQVWGLCYSASRGDLQKLSSYIHQEGININDRLGAEALMLATEQGTVNAIKTLIAAGADVNVSQCEHKIQTPLMTAAENGYVNCLIALIDGGAKVSQVRFDGQTSLAIAILEGCSEDVKIVIDAKTQTKIRPSVGSLVVMANRLWKEQHEECALLLMQAGADIGYTNDSGYNLLMSSAANGSIKTVKSLIEAGANVNQTANNGTTALQLACRCTSLLDYTLYKECVAVLLRAGAVVDAVSLDGKSALMLAVINSTHYKKKFRRTEIIQLLLEAGANPNIQDKLGKTSLIYAAERNLTNICEILMNHSADVSIQDIDGKTAYMYITDYQCLKRLLPPAGTDMFATDSFVFTKPPHPDLTSPDYDQCCEVARHGHLAKNMNIRDKEGRTALMYAAGAESMGCCDLLVGHFCDVNAQDNEGRTALMYGADADCMLGLMMGLPACGLYHNDMRPRPNIQDRTGKTALMHAAEHDIKDCCQHLMKYLHAGVNIQDNQGRTALVYARNSYVLRELLANKADPEIKDNLDCNVLVNLLKRQEPLSDLMKNVTAVLDYTANPVLDPCYHYLLLSPSHSLHQEFLTETLWQVSWMQMIRLFVCNGFVTHFEPPLNAQESHISPLCYAIKKGHFSIAKYLIACCYLSESDLRHIRKLASTITQINGPDIFRDTYKADKKRLFLQQVVSQPWPLVKLAFIAVSSALGSYPKRNENIAQTQLPARLQRMLMFQEPISRLQVSQWPDIPLCFDPFEYERMPQPRPLLYYWPFGRDMVI